MPLTQERLRELLSYDAATGDFRWRVSRRNGFSGRIAGRTSYEGYREIGVDGTLYKAHRLAWLYVHGKWPVNEIDHRNGVRADNRIANLREATRRKNLENQRAARSDNKTGYLGVYVVNGTYRSAIQVAGKHTYLGMFATPELAHAAYVSAKRRRHEGCTL